MADKKAFLLRLDPAVWAELERLAQAELRSVNAQIEFLLRDALSRRGIVAQVNLIVSIPIRILDTQPANRAGFRSLLQFSG